MCIVGNGSLSGHCHTIATLFSVGSNGWVSDPRASENDKKVDRLVYRCADAEDTFACLVDADADALQTANVAINNEGFFGTFVMVPVVDGDFIVERPMQTISRGKLNGVRVFRNLSKVMTQNRNWH